MTRDKSFPKKTEIPPSLGGAGDEYRITEDDVTAFQAYLREPQRWLEEDRAPAGVV